MWRSPRQALCTPSLPPAPLQAWDSSPRVSPCLSASSFHEPRKAWPKATSNPRTRWTFVSDISWGAGITPSGLRSGWAQPWPALPRQGTGEIVEPSRGLFTSPVSFTVGEPARAPPGGLYPRKARHLRRAGLFRLTRRSKGRILFFSPAIEGKKGTLRPIDIHTRKHLGWEITLVSPGDLGSGSSAPAAASSWQNGAGKLWAQRCRLEGETETLKPGLASTVSLNLEEGRKRHPSRPREATRGPKVGGERRGLRRSRASSATPRLRQRGAAGALSSSPGGRDLVDFTAREAVRGAAGRGVGRRAGSGPRGLPGRGRRAPGCFSSHLPRPHARPGHLASATRLVSAAQPWVQTRFPVARMIGEAGGVWFFSTGLG